MHYVSFCISNVMIGDLVIIDSGVQFMSDSAINTLLFYNNLDATLN